MIKTVSQISPETDSAKRFEVIYCKFWFQKLMLHLAHAEITQSHEVIRHYAGSHTYVFGYMQVVTSTYLTLYRQSYLHFSHYVGNHTFVTNFKSFVQFLEFYLFSIWQNVHPNSTTNTCFWANFYCCKWPKFKNNLAIWSHCSRYNVNIHPL